MTVWFSDGFESGNFTAWTGTEVNNEGGGIYIETTAPVYAGSKSARVVLIDAVSGDYARAKKTGLNIAVGNYIFSSARWYFPSAYFNPTANLWLWIIGEYVSPFAGFQVVVNSSEQLYVKNTINTATYTQASPISVPTDQWVGIELEIYAHESAGYIKLRQDGIVIIEQTGIDTQPATNYDYILMGAHYVDGTMTYDLNYYFDKVSIQDSQSLYMHTPSGGLAFGGTAPGLRTFVHLPRGGIVFGGTAPGLRTFVHLPRGGIVFGGSADCIWPQKPKRPRAVVRVKKLSAALEMKTIQAKLETKGPQASLEVH